MIALEQTTATQDDSVLVGKLDLSRHPQLRLAIDAYKWGESKNLSDVHYNNNDHHDIGYLLATIGFLSERVDILRGREFRYLFEDRTASRVRITSRKCCSKETIQLQHDLYPIETIRHKYERSEQAGKDVGEESAKEHFDLNEAKKWMEDCRVVICALCINSPYCTEAQEFFDKFLQIDLPNNPAPVSISAPQWMEAVHGGSYTTAD